MDSEIFPSLENDFIQHKFVPCLADAKVPYLYVSFHSNNLVLNLEYGLVEEVKTH
jgi:hypothetical protein